MERRWQTRQRQRATIKLREASNYHDYLESVFTLGEHAVKYLGTKHVAPILKGLRKVYHI